MSFEDGLLDDPSALARADARLRHLAESGARVRRESVAVAEALEGAAGRLAEWQPRAVLAAGPDSRLLRAVLEPVCPVPFVAWPGRGLPGWAGSLDLAVVLAPHGDDQSSAAAVAEAGRRGCPTVVAAPAESLVAQHAAGRHTTVLPSATGDQLAVAVSVLDLLDRLHLGPRTDPDVVADALDAVAVSCSPHHDMAVNPAKILAIGIAETNPVFWGGTVLAARAARRVAESVRRATGRNAIAGDADQLLAVLEATAPADVFADPYASGEPQERPSLVLLEDETDDPVCEATASHLARVARDRGVRVERISAEAPTEVARYAALLSTGTYAAAYLQVGLGA